MKVPRCHEPLSTSSTANIPNSNLRRLGGVPNDDSDHDDEDDEGDHVDQDDFDDGGGDDDGDDDDDDGEIMIVMMMMIMMMMKGKIKMITMTRIIIVMRKMIVDKVIKMYK